MGVPLQHSLLPKKRAQRRDQVLFLVPLYLNREGRGGDGREEVGWERADDPRQAIRTPEKTAHVTTFRPFLMACQAERRNRRESATQGRRPGCLQGGKEALEAQGPETAPQDTTAQETNRHGKEEPPQIKRRLYTRNVKMCQGFILKSTKENADPPRRVRRSSDRA